MQKLSIWINKSVEIFENFIRSSNSIFRPCGLMYRTIFFFTSSCKPELAHRLQTSKMRRNSTSLDSCQHVDINIGSRLIRFVPFTVHDRFELSVYDNVIIEWVRSNRGATRLI